MGPAFAEDRTSTETKEPTSMGNRVFFRGGVAALTSDREVS